MSCPSPTFLKRDYLFFVKPLGYMIFCVIGLVACSVGKDDSLRLANDRVYLLDPDFPRSGSYSFQEVSWLTVSPQGDEVYFLQRGKPAVSVWSLQGENLRQWSTLALGYPHSLRFQIHPDKPATIWITDMAPPLTAGDIYGHCLKQFDVQGNYLNSIGVCGEDTQGSKIQPLQFDKVTDIAFDSEGMMWVSDGDLHGLSNRVMRIDPVTESVLTLWSAPNNQAGSGKKEFNLPHALQVDSCDRVWIADALNHRIQIISTSGEFLQQLACFGDDGVYGMALHTGPDGDMQLFTTSSPTSSPTGGTVRIFNVDEQCDAPLPVPSSCATSDQWSITLPQGTSTAMLHSIDAANDSESLYLAPLGGDLPPQRWIRTFLPLNNSSLKQ